jgi:hypothetical protein
MKLIQVQVHGDHLERLTKTSPVTAIAELIWNGLDAEASQVEVRLTRTEFDALEAVEVTDDGHGMAADEIEKAFSGLGGSWKRLRDQTRNGRRVLHGKEGLGRFRAFSVGTRVEWTSVADGPQGRHRATVVGTAAAPGTFRASDPEPADEEDTGTVVRLEARDEGVNELLAASCIDKLTYMLAPYLLRYPDASVRYDGREIDPATLIHQSTDYQLETDPAATLTVVEWNRKMDRALVLCDGDGFALHELTPAIQAPGFEFTAYIKSPNVGALGHEAALGEMHPAVAPLVSEARDLLREHFRRRLDESSREIVEGWVTDGVYPYHGEADSPVAQAERTVFDVVAVEVQRRVAGFSTSTRQNRGLSLRLLKEALARSPSAVQAILREVLDLPQDKQEELAELIDRTSLSAIISATKVVADRLEFIAGLEQLLFQRDARRELLERRQLHRIVADQTWIFGEEFALTVDDRSLNEVLRRHLELAGRGEEEIELAASEPVVTPAGEGRGIVDLMLSRLSVRAKNHREHLVVELKRPSVRVGADELTQVEKYAFAVAADDRFRGTDTSWDFWVISTDLDEHARRKARQSDRTPGLVYRDDDAQLRIWAKTWSEVIEECEARMRFFQEQLQYSPTVAQARDHLRAHFSAYLPPSVQEKTEQEPATGDPDDPQRHEPL